jgi:hypothetical protein
LRWFHSPADVNTSSTSTPVVSNRARQAAGAAARPQAPRLAAFLAAVAVALALVTGADAAIVTSQDAQGRTITFDVRDESTNVEWYASLLRSAAHGDEISNVTIRIVRGEEVGFFCGAEAVACYSRNRGRPLMVVPAGEGGFVASTVLHEYAHHLDSSWSVPGVPELNGTPVWWRARGMAALLASGQVAFNYSLGWSRSIAEIFAEDYAHIHLGLGYAIRWLQPPDASLKTALLAELGGAPSAAPPPSATTPSPLVITRRGTLAPRTRRDVPFGLLGPGRRVTLTATVSNQNRAGTRARAQIICDGRTIANQPLVRRRAARTIDLRDQGPAQCVARLVSTSGVRLTYTLRLRLAIQSGT